jgi:hypothetical protein
MLVNFPQPHDGTASAGAIQRLVDQLALQLSRAVLIDDAELRPIAYSPQDVDNIDRVRTVSILRRAVPADVGAYFQTQGIASAHGAVRLRGNARLGLQPRACTPIRHDDRLLGFIWVIEGRRPLNRSELSDMASAGRELGSLLAASAEPRDEIQLRAAIADLLSPDLSTSSGAAADILAAGVLASSAQVAVLVAELVPPADEPVDAATTFLLSRALRSFQDGAPTRAPLVLARRDHGIVILADEDRQRLLSQLVPLGERVRSRLLGVVPEGWGVTVGISDLAPSLPGVPHAYERARRAAIVAARIPQMPAVLQWTHIGIYGLLTPLLEGGPRLDELPPGLMRLLQDRRSDVFLQTLEVYLDNGCDAQAAAAELSLARGSLYYRLGRIAAITQADLHSGQDRLLLHVGLKLARLSGLYGG